MISEYLVIKWLHILAMVYWLGGEWGVFQTSYNVLNAKLTMAERGRHLETAYRIDILARIGILLLFPLGFHMGGLIEAHPWARFIVPVWIGMLAWLSITIAAFIKRGTPEGIQLTLWDERVRYVFIPVLFGTSLYSLLTGGPIIAKWYAAKVLIYSLLLVIGLILRFVMRHWAVIFRRIAVEGNLPELEAQLDREGRLARVLAYFYWVGIASVAFIGVVKPF